MLAKNKPKRLRGQALRDLVDAVFARDEHCCVICGSWVDDGVKPHHEPPGAGRKSDELSKMVLLCNYCHYERHHGSHPNEFRDTIVEYLAEVNADVKVLG